MEKILSADIGASKIRIQTINKEGVSGTEKTISTAGLSLDNESLVKILTDGLKPFIDTEKNSIPAISIAAPGPVDSDDRIIRHTPNIKNVANLEIGKSLENIFHLKTFLLNDADAGALGEWWLGNGKGYKDMIYLTLGTGVGSGIIAGGEPQYDSELGQSLSLTDTKEQRSCHCGRPNCAESFLGTTGLEETYKKIFNNESEDKKLKTINSLSPEMRTGVEANDPKWLEVQDEYSKYLALFIKNIISDYKPQIIVLGGGIAYGNETLLTQTIDKLGTGAQNTIITLAKFENSVNIGLAKYAFDHLAQH